MHIPRILIVVLCASLAACATQKISPQNRAIIHKIRLENPAKGAEPDYYLDQTMVAAEAAGAPFGLIGGLVGGGIAAADRSAGLSRWASITSRHPGQVLSLVHQDIDQEFRSSGKLCCATSGPADAQLKLNRLSFGVTHDHNQSFKAVIAAEAALIKPDGKTVWKIVASGTSLSSFTLEECSANPQAYFNALQQAAQGLAQYLVAAY